MSTVRVIDYNEDQWICYSKERQDHCFEQWIRAARPLGFTFVSLRLNPDPVFPSGTHTKPYVARTEPVGGDELNPYTVAMRVTVHISQDVYAAADDARKLWLLQGARAEAQRYTAGLKGFKWAVECGERTLDHG